MLRARHQIQYLRRNNLKILEDICQQYNLGALQCPPLPLKGGFLHKMYSLFTEKGRYAVKLLNPYIMRRDTAMENYRRAEELELLLENNKLPIIPALQFAGRKMQKIDGQYFYLYEFYDGKSLKKNEIGDIHCRIIGNLLAKIHQLDCREEQQIRNEIHVDWDSYIEQLETKNQELCQLLKDHRAILYESQTNGNLAIKKLPKVVCICHNDMDSKNVLWKGTDCRLIDLESLDYSSPYIEAYELALCWSGYEDCNIDYDLLRSFLCAYAAADGKLLTDVETAYWCNYGRLEWLEYNVKRSLGMECAPDEMEAGISQVKDTMAHVVYYHNIKDKLLSILSAI